MVACQHKREPASMRITPTTLSPRRCQAGVRTLRPWEAAQAREVAVEMLVKKRRNAKSIPSPGLRCQLLRRRGEAMISQNSQGAGLKRVLKMT